MTFMSYLFAQLPYLVIQAGAFAIGIVLSMSYMKSAPRPAMFALGGSALLLATTVGTTMMTAYLVTERPGTFGMWMTFNTVVGSVLRAAGFGLLLAAAFAERGSASSPGGSGSLSDRIGKVCAACGARGPVAASFCMHCGAAHS